MRRISLLLCIPVAFAIAAQAPVKTKTIKDVQKGKWTVDVQYPVLSGSSATIRMANRVFERSARNGLAKFYKDAKEYQAADPRPAADQIEYYYDVGVVVRVAKPNLVSGYFALDNFMGGAHGMHWFEQHTVGLVGGKVRELKLRDLFRRGVDARAKVSAIVIAKLKKEEGADWVQSGEVKSLTQQQADAFVVTPKGLLYLFPPYAMGSYASGSFTVEVSWRELRGFVDPKGPVGSFR